MTTTTPEPLFHYPENVILHVAVCWEHAVHQFSGTQYDADTSSDPWRWMKKFKGDALQWQLDYARSDTAFRVSVVVRRLRGGGVVDSKAALTLGYEAEKEAFSLKAFFAPTGLEFPDGIDLEQRRRYQEVRERWIRFLERAAHEAVKSLLPRELPMPMIRKNVDGLSELQIAAGDGRWEIAFFSPAIPDIHLASTGGYPMPVCGEITFTLDTLAFVATSRSKDAVKQLTMEDFL